MTTRPLSQEAAKLLEGFARKNESESDFQKEFEDVFNSGSQIAESVKTFSGLTPALVKYNDVDVLRRAEITMIQGAFGSHKSRLASTIAGLLLAKPDCQTDFLGLTKSKVSTGCWVLYIDTERSVKERLPHAVINMNRIAGYTKENLCPYLFVYSLTGASTKNSLPIVKELVTRTRETMNDRGVGDWDLIVILDVITDCVGSINDERENTELYKFLRSTIGSTNTSVIGVIHENPGTNKATGHTGTNGGKKASQMLQIKEDEKGIYRISFFKASESGKEGNIYVRWSDTAKWIVKAETPVSDRFDTGKLYEFVKPIFANSAKVSRSTLKASLRSEIQSAGERGTSNDALNQKINAMIAAGFIDVLEVGSGNKPDILTAGRAANNHRVTKDFEPLPF